MCSSIIAIGLINLEKVALRVKPDAKVENCIINIGAFCLIKAELTLLDTSICLHMSSHCYYDSQIHLSRLH
ncbi:hypothetical protein P8452_76616 [Trifolium repens]|nr:hypothetical protein P8452_76616 [Trifolium repens]